MEVILLQRVPKLGQMGEVVRVKDGFARNYLLPRGVALRANEANRKRFESQRTQLEARNLELKREADTVHEKLDGQSIVMIRQSAETGQLYGSVTTRDIAAALAEAGFTVARAQVELPAPIKTLGVHQVTIRLHPEVESTVTVNVARSQDEAERQARGEDVVARDREEAEIDLAGLFEGGLGPRDEETGEPAS